LIILRTHSLLQKLAILVSAKKSSFYFASWRTMIDLWWTLLVKNSSLCKTVDDEQIWNKAYEVYAPWISRVQTVSYCKFWKCLHVECNILSCVVEMLLKQRRAYHITKKLIIHSFNCLPTFTHSQYYALLCSPFLSIHSPYHSLTISFTWHIAHLSTIVLVL